MTLKRRFSGLVLGSVLLLPVLAGGPAAAEEAGYRENVVAGGPGKFMEVRHVIIRGSDYQIGKRIGEIAKKSGRRPGSRGDAILNRTQRKYVMESYPALYHRMRGIADAFALDIGDDSYDFSSILMFPAGPAGCSAVFYPGEFTSTGHGILSRNYDFTTGTMQGKRPGQGEEPVMSRPFIFELYPEKGYASIAICGFEMVGGVLDGVNEKGLAVSVFGDESTVMEYGLHPSNNVGLPELMSMRYLLDTCADVEEAREALLLAKHVYSFIPCHYLIADRSGKSFIFEFSPFRQRTFILEGEGPQCVTNHLVSRYPKTEQFPDSVMLDTFDRYRALSGALKGRTSFTIEEIESINKDVSNTAMAFDNPDYAPGRTLWYSQYDTYDSSLKVRFYLGETADPEDDDSIAIEYSDWVHLKLKAPGS